MKVILAMTLAVLSAALGYSQSVPTPDERSRELRKRAQAILAETPHRVTMTVEMRDSEESAWELYSSQAKEKVGRDRWHLVQHTGLKRELIGIGDQTYQKMPDGSWQLQPPAKAYTGPTVRNVGEPVIESAVDEKKGGTTIETNGQGKIQIIRTGEIVNGDRKLREWYDESGRLTRVETEHFNFERKKLQRVTEVYEYDPTIKIEAPIP